MNDDSISDEDNTKQLRKLKKRAKTGRMTAIIKKLETSTHKTEPVCLCKRQYFIKVFEDRREQIIRQFNELEEILYSTIRTTLQAHRHSSNCTYLFIYKKFQKLTTLRTPFDSDY